MKFEKVMKKIVGATFEEMDKMDEAALNKTIANAEEKIAKATKEKNANSKYRSAKAIVNDLNAGLKGVKEAQQAKIEFALMKLRLNQRDGAEDLSEEELDVLNLIDAARSKIKAKIEEKKS